MVAAANAAELGLSGPLIAGGARESCCLMTVTLGYAAKLV